MLRFALFDLDNTIYPQDSGLLEAIGDRINLFMVERLGYHPGDVHERRDHYYRAFGTTLNALRHRYGIDAEEFLAFVHDLPLERYIHRDSGLDGMLERLPLRKIIFTNSDAPHARRVLERLGVVRHFERIIDIQTLEFVNKPDVRAYERALELLGARPEECLFVEDSPANLAPARRLGMVTVLVSVEDGADEGTAADCRIAHLLELEGVAARFLGVGPRPPAG